MSDVLGHDIDGRPLRVGDDVLVVAKGADTRGETCHVVDKCNCGCNGALISIKSDWSKTGYKSAYFRSLKKIQNDHRPADESFSDLMQKLKVETA